MSVVPLELVLGAAKTRIRVRLPRIKSWMVKTGTRVDVGLAALILDARDEGLADLGPPDLWTRPIVYHVLSCDVFNWCSRRRVLAPKAIPQTFEAYLRFLSEVDLLESGSDALPVLLEPIRCYGGFGPHPDHCTCFDP